MSSAMKGNATHKSGKLIYEIRCRPKKDTMTYKGLHGFTSFRNQSLVTPKNFSLKSFWKDFAVAHRSLHKGVKFFERDISTLAAKKWSEQPASVRIFFRQLELIALKKHKEIYPNYSYKPKKKSLNFQNGDLEGNFETFTPKEIDQCAETTENIINPNPQVVG
ncbi:6108_t:CDS:2, partial [Scutellospora calospora]